MQMIQLMIPEYPIAVKDLGISPDVASPGEPRSG